MALSNLKKEPRREITEQIVGTIVIASLVAIDYVSVHSFSRNPFDLVMAMVFFPIMLVSAGLMIWQVSLAVHSIGEGICDALARKGFEIRPRQR